jgi:hypothetical protein
LPSRVDPAAVRNKPAADLARGPQRAQLGALLPIGEAASFITSHIGEGQIRVANREFTSFVVVAINGVATGWRMADNMSP